MNNISTTEEYSLMYEFLEKENIYAIHCYVERWNKRVFKEILMEFSKFLNIHKGCLIVCVTSNRKFAEMYGAIFIGEIMHNGELKGVYKWEAV